jgi:hypothetical protein
LIARGLSVIALLVGCDAAPKKFVDAPEIFLRLAQRRLHLLGLRLRSAEGDLVSGRINPEEHLALLDPGALLILAPEQKPADARADLNIAETRDAASILDGQGHLGRLNDENADFRWRRSLRRGWRSGRPLRRDLYDPNA